MSVKWTLQKNPKGPGSESFLVCEHSGDWGEQEALIPSCIRCPVCLFHLVGPEFYVLIQTSDVVSKWVS